VLAPDLRHRLEAGIFGWLESPRPNDILQDCVFICGWAFSRDVPIERVFVRGFGHDIDLECRTRRDDVAATYRGDDEAIASGFSGYLELGAAPGRATIEIWARLRDGRDVRLFTWSAGRARLRRWLRSTVLTPLREYRDETAAAAARRALSVGFERSSRLRLRAFLENDKRLVCPRSDAPRVTVVIALWNRAELTLRALKSVSEQDEVDLDIVLVDNGSTDETPRLLERLDGPAVLRNPTNLGFTVAANQGARVARGGLLLFLNSDAVLHPGALRNLVEVLDRSAAIGAAGGKLIWPDGRLQEAGAVVWNDGSCEGYGRGGDPEAFEYGFERDVDFCSGAMLLTRRDLFLQLGGFDERYKPAYYEDVDYCVRLWQAGWRVTYTPRAAATHVEFASSGSSGEAARLQRERHGVFVSLHRDWLRGQPPRSKGMLAARSRPRDRPWALVIDDDLPDAARGAGFPRAAALLRALRALGWFVSVYPTNGTAAVRRCMEFRDVEVLRPEGPQGLRPLFESLAARFQLIIVSRAHNMRYVKAALGRDLAGVSCPIVYDSEALFALREDARRRLTGTQVSGAAVAASLKEETGLAVGCAAVFAVSPMEQRHFVDAGISRVSVLGHAVELAPTAADFHARRSILFVGAFSPDSPNEDAVRFLLVEVYPALRGTAAGEAPLVVAGAGIPDTLRATAPPGVVFRSDVPDLTPLYEDARVFVAPTRFSAGIPLKLVEAAARGVPIVCTTLLARQLGWVSGTDLVAADRPDELAGAIAAVYSDSSLWESLRRSAMARVGDDYSRDRFESQLKAALDGIP
jgi:GT2 family glycosyltransferase